VKLGLLIGGSVIILVGTILTVVFTIIGRVQRTRLAAARAALQPEGIRLDSGLVGGTARFRGFSAPGMYEGGAIRGVRSCLVLTDKQLAILGGRPAFHTPRGELSRWQVGLDGARLRLVSDDPPGAKGHVDLRLAVPDAEAWVAALREAGCPALSAA